MKTKYLAIALFSFVAGLAIFFWATDLVRGYGGDIVVMIFLYSLLSLFVQAKPRTKAMSIFAVALIIECSQLLPFDAANPLAELLVGQTFDPYDLLAYALGLGIAMSLE